MDSLRHRLKEHYGGWVPQAPDQRDYQFLPTVAAHKLPSGHALDITGIPTLDQGRQGSCEGHGGAGIMMYAQKSRGDQIVVPSRSMIYFNARIPEGTTGVDSGAVTRDMVAGLVKYGACPDSEFPYNDQVFDVAPTDQDYTDGLKQRVLAYEAVNYGSYNAALASGYPFVFGFVVYESFESDQSLSTGIVPIPKKDEQVLGGHCVWSWAYNSSYTNHFQTPNNKLLPPRTKAIRNSWSENVGDGGDFYLPQWYFDKGQCSDAWVIRSIA